MIRKITRDDRQEYLSMAKAFYASDAVLHDISEENLTATFEEMMRSDVYAEGFILETEKETAGYGLIAKTFSQEAGGMVVWLEELYLKPQYRNRGLGQEYFRYIMEHYEAARFRLEVEEDNTRAKSLYRRLGFEMLDYLQMIKE